MIAASPRSAATIAASLFLLLACSDGNDDGDRDPVDGGSGDPDGSYGDPDPPLPDGGGTPVGEYEGFGAVTRGAEGCSDYDIVEVTNLNDSGPGSLRQALSGGCRRVEFTVGGTIDLDSSISLDDDYVTLDGSTAPSPGITITKDSVSQNLLVLDGVTDVIITHVRFIGMSTNCDDNCGDNLAISGSTRVVVDHVSSGHADDGAIDIAWGWNETTSGWANSDVTVSWSLIYRTSKAMLIKYGPHRNLSIHHNVYARNTERNPQVRHQVETIDYVNNVVYLWGQEPGEWGYGLRIYDHDPDGSSSYGGDGLVDINCIGNAFIPAGANTANAVQLPDGGGNGSRGSVFFDDNVVPSGNDATLTSTVGSAISIPASARVTTYGSETLGTTVVPNVGTHYPTSEESALLTEVAEAFP